MNYEVVMKVEKDGKWVEIDNPFGLFVTEDNWSYPGAGRDISGTSYRILKTRTTKDKRFYYLVDAMDERLKKVPYLKCMVEWNNGSSRHYYMSPKKYKEGKKCVVDYDAWFIIGKVVERFSVYHHVRYSNVHGGSSATCMI